MVKFLSYRLKQVVCRHEFLIGGILLDISKKKSLTEQDPVSGANEERF
jgi:hypothetical protein